LIGLFLKTLVLRTKLQGNPTFRELLQQVRQVTLAAYAHQDVPFEQLLETLRPPRDASYSPWFQVMLILNNTPSESLILPELTVTPLTTQGETAKFDLTLALREQDQGVRGGFEYSTDLFEAATIGRMVEHFQTLLAGIVSSPDEPVAALPLMPAAKAGLIDEAKTLARLLADLEDLSEAEVEQLLCRESQP
jgi:non-ribosomal peptide synthetase component F